MRQKLSETLKNLNKKYGKGTIGEIKKEDDRGKIDWVSTNCYSMDRVMGEGLPIGRIIDIFGTPSSGKSTMGYYFIAQIQKNGGTAALIDAEYAFVSEYAQKIGVDVDKLILSQPITGEEGLDMVEKLVKTGDVDIIVVDSTAALVPSDELKKEITDTTIALQARMMSKALRMITGIVARTKTVIIFISQVRDKVGMFVGPSTDSTGGKALKFYSAIRLKVDKMKSIKDKDNVVIGNRLKIQATKNKVSMPFGSAEIDLYFERGIDVVGDLLDVATNSGIINRIGNTYFHDDLKLGTSRSLTITYLQENETVIKEIKKKLYENRKTKN